MKCERCQQNEATFFYEENVNGTKRSLRLCAACAAKMQAESPAPAFGGFGSHLLDGLFGLSAAPVAEPRKTCPGCNATWSALAKAGKAFCPQCYTAFADELEPSLRSLYGNHVRHTGRAPAGQRAAQERRDTLASLKKQLAEAIAAEKYEDAAQLRDQIRALEKE